MQPRKYGKLTRATIAGAALQIIDEVGLPGLSMRTLGASLHVESMTLYRYFPEKEAILDQLAEMVLEEVALPATRGGWQTDLRTAALRLREHLLLHPNAMPLVAARWMRIPVLHGMVKAAIERMVGDGLDESSARSVIHAVMSFVLGHCWMAVEGYVGELPDTGGLTRKPVRPFVADPTDIVQETERLQFERGLDFLLGGVTATACAPL